MNSPRSHPAVVRVARALGLSGAGDSVSRLREYAVARVHTLAAAWPVASLQDLQLLVANALSVCLEYVRSDGDVAAIAQAHHDFSPHLHRTLTLEFLQGDTEGLLLPHPYPQLGDLRYLAVIDLRGPRAVR